MSSFNSSILSLRVSLFITSIISAIVTNSNCFRALLEDSILFSSSSLSTVPLLPGPPRACFLVDLVLVSRPCEPPPALPEEAFLRRSSFLSSFIESSSVSVKDFCDINLAVSSSLSAVDILLGNIEDRSINCFVAIKDGIIVNSRSFSLIAQRLREKLVSLIFINIKLTFENGKHGIDKAKNYLKLTLKLRISLEIY
uniref:Uncharacterized protein n=1 Tax=Glossina pallidipes TaxID=7398 RepID=A0A1A9ZAA6_GLOPL